MQGLIAFWGYALAACLFASILAWRLRGRAHGADKWLLAALLATTVWATMSAVRGPLDAVTVAAETLRNLFWLILLHRMWRAPEDRSRRGLRLVFAAVALVIGLQLALNMLVLVTPLANLLLADVTDNEQLLRITMAAGALILVHNLYGQASPESRLEIRAPMLGLTLMWGYDLNLYTTAFLGAHGAATLFDWRGPFATVIAPLFAVHAAGAKPLNVKLSRAATFQSLSLIGISAYLAIMAVLATALRRAEWDWASAVTAALLAGLTVGAATLALSQWARGWMKVKLTKHLFEHRYDYRGEWLRFTETLGNVGPDAPALGERIIKAFADVADAPGGLLLVGDGGRGLAVAASWNWGGADPAADQLDQAGQFWSDVEASGRILEFDSLRQGWADPKDKAVAVPEWIFAERGIWAGIPLVHHQRLTGIVLLAAPEYRRALDWEDFDLLRTAGKQAASSLAEALGQEALADAQRFEEFNRRFAFILHDVKNLVSQLSLLARNAERHADNPDFRADMVATLKSSVGKMNDLLARLAPHSAARVQAVEPQPLRPILTAAIAGKRRDREVQLLGDTGLWALADSAALEQAVGHILQNALDASTAAPVTVRVDGDDSLVTIAIADKGIGMDSDFVRNRLFQPFASTKAGGFGIGAFEARSLIKAMGGKLGVDSRPGKGTTFTITLPAAEQPSLPASEPERKRA